MADYNNSAAAAVVIAIAVDSASFASFRKFADFVMPLTRHEEKCISNRIDIR